MAELNKFKNQKQPYDITVLPNYNPALPFSGLTPEQQKEFESSSSNYTRNPAIASQNNRAYKFLDPSRINKNEFATAGEQGKERLMIFAPTAEALNQATNQFQGISRGGRIDPSLKDIKYVSQTIDNSSSGNYEPGPHGSGTFNEWLNRLGPTGNATRQFNAAEGLVTPLKENSADIAGKLAGAFPGNPAGGALNTALPSSFYEKMNLAGQAGILNYTGTPQQNAQIQQFLAKQKNTPPSAQTTPTGQNLAIKGNLQQGSKDVQVGNLQKTLNEVAQAGLVVDNNFGPKTKQAVMAFQTANGLVADGVVGPKTLAKIQELQGQKTQQQNIVQNSVDNVLTQSGIPEPAQILPEKFATNPTQTVQDIVNSLSQTSGLSQLNNQITELTKQKQELANKKNEELNSITNNPWISEGLKQKKISSLDQKYQLMEKNINDSLSIATTQLGNAEEQVRYITSTALNQYNSDRTFNETKAQNAIENALASTKLESGIVGEYQYAVQQGYTGSFTQYQNEDANRKERVAKAGAATTTILPSGQNLNTKETSEALGTVNDISNLLDDPNFNSAFGATGLVKTRIPTTPEYAIGAQVQQVKDKLALAARGKLKGQGQVSNFEGLMLANAQTSLRTGMNPKDARQEMVNIAGALTTSTGGKAKVQLKEKSGAVYTIMADSRGITIAIADGLQVKYVE